MSEPCSRLFMWALTCLLSCVFCLDAAQALERRRDQFSKEPGHYIVPAPISYPGIGDALALFGVMSNAHDSYTDYAGFIITGDIEGIGAVTTDIHLIDRTLIGEVAAQKISKVAVVSYHGRGMEGDRNDYSILEFDDAQSTAARLKGTFVDRMLELQAQVIKNEIHLKSLRDSQGALIRDASNSQASANQYYTLSLQFDWTDDYQDPRRGVRYSVSRWWRDETAATSAEYYQQEHNLTAYIPIGRISTWAFNYFRSDAFVTRMGETNFAAVENLMGLNCSALSLTAQQRLSCEQAVNNTIAHNRYGTAESMGGASRLRSYQGGRYKGAHVLFYGTEIRWNLTEEFQPFDIYIARDIRTGVQLSFFWETATVADEKDKLGDIWRDSYGMGLRLVMSSGLVFRAEVATGDEGSQKVLFFNYPWSGF